MLYINLSYYYVKIFSVAKKVYDLSKYKTTGIDTIDDPIRQAIYTYTWFKSMAIPRDMDFLSSITGTIESNINFL